MMTEKEMEDLLWEHPEQFLNEPLAQFRRQPSSDVGRADLVFTDRIGRLLLIELKRGKLPRGAIEQLHDYYGMMKSEFPDKPVELMVIANDIPPERRLACERLDIEWREISQKKFKDVADQSGYVFRSERYGAEEQFESGTARTSVPVAAAVTRTDRQWFHDEKNEGRYFFVFVNAKGNCSMRRFNAGNGAFCGKQYGSGDFRHAFAEFLVAAKPLQVTKHPNLEATAKTGLSPDLLRELQSQVARPEGKLQH
jgi:hypothetical protein